MDMDEIQLHHLTLPADPRIIAQNTMHRMFYEGIYLNQLGYRELAKTTMSTKIAQNLHCIKEEFKEAKDLIPSKYHSYLDVFAERPNKQLPP